MAMNSRNSVMEISDISQRPHSDQRHALIAEKLRDALFSAIAAKYDSQSSPFSSEHLKSEIHRRLHQCLPSFHTPTHLPYASMIQRAIVELGEENGSTEETVSNFIKKEYEDLPWAHAAFLRRHLGKLCESGELVRSKCGRYKFELEDKGVKKKKQKRKTEGRSRSKRGESKEDFDGKKQSQNLMVIVGLSAEHIEKKGQGKVIKEPMEQVYKGSNREEGPSSKETTFDFFVTKTNEGNVEENGSKDARCFKKLQEKSKSLEFSDAKSGFANDEANETVANDEANETVANDGANETVANDGANETVADDGANETVADDGANETVANDGANETVANDEANETVANDGANETVANDGANETVANDGANETVADDGANETVADDGANETVADDGANETVYVQSSKGKALSGVSGELNKLQAQDNESEDQSVLEKAADPTQSKEQLADTWGNATTELLLPSDDSEAPKRRCRGRPRKANMQETMEVPYPSAVHSELGDEDKEAMREERDDCTYHIDQQKHQKVSMGRGRGRGRGSGRGRGRGRGMTRMVKKDEISMSEALSTFEHLPCEPSSQKRGRGRPQKRKFDADVLLKDILNPENVQKKPKYC